MLSYECRMRLISCYSLYIKLRVQLVDKPCMIMGVSSLNRPWQGDEGLDFSSSWLHLFSVIFVGFGFLHDAHTCLASTLYSYFYQTGHFIMCHMGGWERTLYIPTHLTVCDLWFEPFFSPWWQVEIANVCSVSVSAVFSQSYSVEVYGNSLFIGDVPSLKWPCQGADRFNV